MWFLYPVTRPGAGPDLRARARKRERDREQLLVSHRFTGPPLEPVVPTRDDPVERVVRPLSSDRSLHLGRRGDRRSDERISREERQQAVLWMLGVFRVATRRSLVDACFDGHPFAANRVLGELESKGLVSKRQVKHGKRGYQVYHLEGQARDRLAAERLRLEQGDSTAGAQSYWKRGGDERQLRHDHQVYDAVRQDVRDVLLGGGRVVRVRLEAELRGRLAAAEETALRAGGIEKARAARREEARRLGLHVFVAGVPLPDAVIELEESDGRRVVRAVELATGHYNSKQVQQKHDAGFRVYSPLPWFKTAGNRRPRATLAEDKFFPLSWGR